VCTFACSQSQRNVGDIPFDPNKDDAAFKICKEGSIKQYYIRGSTDTPPGYNGEKRGMEKEILTAYEFPETSSEEGYLTIRFIVNCEGQSGRFRIEEMDLSYQPKSFDKRISQQLLEIVKGLDGWIPRKSPGKNVDFYQYLTFRIEKGQIVKILP
jgi:hypothetical protein